MAEDTATTEGEGTRSLPKLSNGTIFNDLE